MTFRRSARILSALIALAVLALAALAFVGVGVDAQRWREPMAAALSRALGRDVRLHGPARLTVSLHSDLVLGDIRIANPPAFDAPDFARIGELRLAIDLLPLLRGEIRVRELRGRDVIVRLVRATDGRGNWMFDAGARNAPASDEPVERPRLDVHRVALENVRIEYVGAGATRRFDLTEITGDAGTGQSVGLSLRGTVAKQFAYTVDATSAPLSGLGAAQPWPFEFQLFFLGTVLNGSGTIGGSREHPTVRLAVGAGTQDIREIGNLLDIKVPPVGAAAIAAELDVAPGGTALRSINAVIGATAVSGDLALDASGTRPKLTGRLALHEFGSRPVVPDAKAAEVATLAAAYRELESTDFDLKRLASLDADVQLGVAHWAGLPADVRDVSANLRIDAGKLTAPLQAMIGAARFEGGVSADGTATPPRLRVHLAARAAPLGGLAELVFDAPYVAGSARRFEVTLDARGRSADELARSLDGRIRVQGAQLTYGNFAGGKPVAMRLDAAEVSQLRGGTILGTLRGALRGKPFDGTFRAGTVAQILRERRTAFDFDGTSGGVRARLSGTLVEPTDAQGPEIAFEVTAPRARELTPWLGFSSASDARVALKGTVQVRQHQASLSGGSLLFGRTSIAGDVAWQAAGGKPLVTANLVAELLAPAELRALTVSTPGRTTVFEIPILPESLNFADSDLEVRVKRVDGLPLEIADVVFQGRMRGGAITPSPFSLRVERNALAGAVALDARGATPTASLWLAGDDFDVGALLRRLRVARDIDSRIGTVRLYADIRERRLGDVLEQSSFVASIESGTLDFRDANTRAALRIAVDAGEVRADPGGPVTASMTGTAGTTPVALKAQAGRLRELVEPAERLPFTLTAETPAAKLAISGAAAPQRDPDVALSLALTGERLSGLDAILETSLPPWGPYALTARLRLAARGYEVDGMRLALGDSVLEGKGSLDTARAPPKLDVAFAAERIQLDDFPFGDWSPFGRRVGPGTPLTVGTAREAVAGGARGIHALLSRELLGRLDADLDVAVKQVVSGKDELGRGRLAVTVADGHATIAPLAVESGAGAAQLALFYKPRAHDVLVDAHARVDRLEYGALARRLRPGSDLAGTFSLDLRLTATAPQLAAALATGSGRFDFAVWPRHLSGGLFDLWTANLLLRLLPFVDQSASPVNCVVGQFDLEDGTLRSVRLAIDTVNSRTEGGGRADFGSGEVHLRLVPRPKVAQFFSFATPIEVSGTLEDYRIRMLPTDTVGTAMRWASSPALVPLQRFVRDRVPGDGRDVCGNPEP
ncbi:MAG: AsmA family protein [Burkholderiales bacterium]